MNLTLHHFRKEVLYLLPKWLPWLALLLVELALNLGWIAPMTANGASSWWITLLPYATWGLAFWLLWSEPPEDHSHHSNGFLVVRPLRKKDRLLARLLVLVLLILLPLAVQEVFHVWGSGRSLGEALRSGGVQTMVALGLYAWCLPFRRLWRGWPALAAFVCLIIGQWGGTILMDALGGEEVSYFPAFNRFHHTAGWLGLMVLAVILGMLATLRSWPDRPLWLRLSGVLMASGLAFLAIWLSPLVPPAFKPAAQARVDELAKEFSVTVRPSSTEFTYFPRDGQKSWFARFEPEYQGRPQAVQLDARNTKLKVTQGGKACGVSPLPWFKHPLLHQILRGYRFDESGDSDRAVSELFPPGTLLTTGHPRTSYSFNKLGVGQWVEPMPDFKKPMSFESTWEFDWHQWQVLAELPARPDAQARHERGQWKIGGVRLHQGMKGMHQPGAISIDFDSLVHQRNLNSVLPLKAWETPDQVLVALYSPDRQIAWIQPHGPWQESRATASQWVRRMTTVTYPDVLNYKDGSIAKIDPSQLQVWIIDKTFLGTSRWEWRPKPMRMADHLEGRGREFSFGSTKLYQGREAEAFARFQSKLKPSAPGPDTPKNEVHQYLAELLMLFSSVSGYQSNHSANELLATALAPVAEHHLDVLLALPNEAFGRVINQVIEKYLSEGWRDPLIDQLPDKPQFGTLIIKKKWTPEVRRVLPELSANYSYLQRGDQQILLALDDPLAQQRLMEELRERPNNYLFSRLRTAYPKLIPELDQIAAENFQKVNPVLQSYHEQARILIAAAQGDKKALDLGMRWVALGGETGAENYDTYVTELANGLVRLLGLLPEAKIKDFPNEELWPLFRDLRASDFQYLPAERRWEKRPGL